MKKYLKFSLFTALALFLLLPQSICALSSGYILTGAYGGTSTVLFDTIGNTAFTWDHNKMPNRLDGYSSYLLKNGNLLRTAIVPESQVVSVMAPRQGIIEEIDPKGDLVWRYTLANDTFMLHHDIKPMPNGHVLAVTFEVQVKSQMKAAGIDTSLINGMKNPVFILSEKIIEIDPTAAGGPEIVWEWKIHDHIVKGDDAAAHPELISGSITRTLFYTNQWVHLNGLDYNAELDMVLFSSRVFSELYIIDHGTTTAEASGHTGGARGKGGDILYRWGKPANYKMTGGTTINVLHCVNWIPKGYPGAGNIIFFHNGSSKSQVVEVKPPMDDNGNFIREANKPFGPEQPTWLYAPTSTFYSFSMSSAFRLPNGNTLAHLAYPSSGGMDISGNGVVVEIDPDKKVVWSDTIELKGEKVEAGSPSVYNPAKIMYYEKGYEGINKLFGVSVARQQENTGLSGASAGLPRIHRRFESLEFSNVEQCRITVFDAFGRSVLSAVSVAPAISIGTRSFSPGVYYAKITFKNQIVDLEKFSVVN